MKKLRPVQQMEAAECGVACLAMVLEHHGAAIPLEELREICGTSRDGNSALDLVQAAERLGLAARGLRLEPTQLGQHALPSILHWGLAHFVVLESISAKGLVIVDPASGRGKVDWEEVGRRFSGIALELSPTPRLSRRRRSSPGAARYLRGLGRFRNGLALVVAAGAAAQALGVVAPAVQQLLVDEVIRPQRGSWLLPVLSVLVASSLVGLALQWIYQFALAHLQTALSASLTRKLGQRLLELPLTFIESRGRGDLVQRVATYGGLGSLLTSTALGAFHALFAFSLAGLMLAYDARLAALALAVDVARLVLLRTLREDCRQRSAAELAARSRESSVVLQATSMPELVKAFGLERRLERWYASRLRERLDWTVRSARLGAHVGSWLLGFDGFARAAVLWYGGVRAIDGEIALGVFAGFLAMRSLMAAPLASLLTTLEGWIDFRSVLTRTDEIQRQQPPPRGTRPLATARARLELSNVGFRYGSGSPWIFRGLNLAVEPGQSVTLIGPSGGGKSTLLRILAGIVEPTEGRVLIDGVPLCDHDPTTLAQKLGTVLGDPLVLPETVAQNLRLRLPDASDEQLRRACERARFTPVMARLPRGDQSVLAAGGGNLSGGERQRLGIAQAIVGEPELLFLDEATCYLDAETEGRVVANVAEMGATLISVAHRPRVIQASDRVWQVGGGQVVEIPHAKAESAHAPPAESVSARAASPRGATIAARAASPRGATVAARTLAPERTSRTASGTTACSGAL